MDINKKIGDLIEFEFPVNDKDACLFGGVIDSNFSIVLKGEENMLVDSFVASMTGSVRVKSLFYNTVLNYLSDYPSEWEEFAELMSSMASEVERRRNRENLPN